MENKRKKYYNRKHNNLVAYIKPVTYDKIKELCCEEPTEKDRNRKGFYKEDLSFNEHIYYTEFIDEDDFKLNDYVEVDEATDEIPYHILEKINKLKNFINSERFEQLNQTSQTSYILQLKHLQEYYACVCRTENKPEIINHISFSDALMLMKSGKIFRNFTENVIYFYLESSLTEYNENRDCVRIASGIYQYNTKHSSISPYTLNLTDVSSETWQMINEQDMAFGEEYSKFIKKINAFKEKFQQ